MTAFKQGARLRQARWRDAAGLPIGTNPPRGGPRSAPLGSRLALQFAIDSGANFLTDQIRAAVRDRLAHPQEHQTLDSDRLWGDLLSSMPMCFNLLGSLHEQPDALANAVASWWPDAPGAPNRLWFEWSPGRRDPDYLNNRTACDAAITLDLPDGTNGVIGIETKYHEHPKTEERPPDHRLGRYLEVSDASGAFAPGAAAATAGTPLQQIWLDHLLILAMLQHPSGQWAWGRFVLVHPSGNTGFGRLADEYRTLLVDPSTFESRTIESLLDVDGALPSGVVDGFRDRYLFD